MASKKRAHLNKQKKLKKKVKQDDDLTCCEEEKIDFKQDLNEEIKDVKQEKEDLKQEKQSYKQESSNPIEEIKDALEIKQPFAQVKDGTEEETYLKVAESNLISRIALLSTLLKGYTLRYPWRILAVSMLILMTWIPLVILAIPLVWAVTIAYFFNSTKIHSYAISSEQKLISLLEK